MTIFADTGVLLRLLEATDPFHGDASRAITVILARNDEIVMAHQNVAEFWNVCTRPKSARNGLGLSIQETDLRVQQVESVFRIIVELPTSYPIWRRLVVTHSVRGKQVHDAKLTATMMAHGIDTILTFNGPDFSRFPGITTIDPRTV